MSAIHIAIAAAMLATLAALATGVIIMAAGGDANARWGNRLMVARVAFQALAVALIGLAMLAEGS